MTGKHTSETIEHSGIVISSDSKSVKVSITSATACSGCHAEGVCSLSGSEKKTIEVKGHYPFNPGDSVMVGMEKSMGTRALFFGYIFPVVVVVISLIVMIMAGVHEGISGLISLLFLAAYYFLIYLFRKQIDRQFIFTIKTL